MYRWKQTLAEDGGATAVEYAMLLGLIILVSVTTLGGFGVGLKNIYDIIDTSLPNR